MSGLYTTRQKETSQPSLGEQLRRLREQAGKLGREVAAGVEMDSAVLSKVENGRRPVTQPHLAALAKFFNVELGPLEAKRIAEEVRRWYPDNPALADAGVILQEASGEYRVKKKPIAVSNPAKSVNKRGKSK